MTRVGPNQTQTAPAAQIILWFDVKEKAAHASTSFFFSRSVSVLRCFFSILLNYSVRFQAPLTPAVVEKSIPAVRSLILFCNVPIKLGHAGCPKKLIAVTRYFLSRRWRINSEIILVLTDQIPIFLHTGTDQLIQFFCCICRGKSPT